MIQLRARIYYNCAVTVECGMFHVGLRYGGLMGEGLIGESSQRVHFFRFISLS